jgi:ribosomal protein L17
MTGLAGEEACNAFLEARALYAKLKDDSEETQMLREAATALVHHDSRKTAKLLEEELVPRLVDAGKFDEVGKLHRQIAETVAEEDMDASLEHYRAAVGMFISGGSRAEALKCQIKIGEMAAVNKDYREAEEMFVAVSGPGRRPRGVPCYEWGAGR